MTLQTVEINRFRPIISFLKKTSVGRSNLLTVVSLCVSVGLSSSVASTNRKDSNNFTGHVQLRGLTEPHRLTCEGRVCPRCGQFKSISEFYKNRSKPDGHESHCKTCVLARKARPKLITGGPIELTLNLKASKNFEEGLNCILDIICKEIVGDA